MKSKRDDHSRIVLETFNDRASVWDAHYRPGAGMAPRRERFVHALSSCTAPGSRVLDYGCGTGQIARAMADQNYRVTACDISSEMLARARKNPDGHDITWKGIDPDNPSTLPFPSDVFDAVVSSSVFEYLAEPGEMLSECCRVLRVGGWLLLTVPDMRHAIRLKEDRKVRLARFTPIWILMRRTPWRHRYNYYRLSINRWSVEQWCASLGHEGFCCEPVSVCSEPLMLLAARKLELPSRARE